MKLTIILMISISSLFANDFFNKVEIDEKETINNVALKSGKKGDHRYYEGKIKKEFNTNIDSLKNAIMAFDQRCNNEYKDKRKLTDKKTKCKYHNGNVIENFIHRDLKAYTKEKNEIDRIMISRRIYNREEFSQTDIVKVYEYQEDGKKVVKITMDMLKEKQAKEFIEPKVKTESAFSKAYGVFLLKEIAPNKIELTYTYSSKTDHWLINKSIAAGEVFENMAKSLNNLFVNLAKESQSLMAKN
jgi:hypothetical protein